MRDERSNSLVLMDKAGTHQRRTGHKKPMPQLGQHSQQILGEGSAPPGQRFADMGRYCPEKEKDRSLGMPLPTN